MATKSKTKYLVAEVMRAVKKSYQDWCVGTSDRSDLWRLKKHEMVIFNLIDDDATREAYNELVKMGMKGRQPIGKQPFYLYLHRADMGMLPDEFVY